MRYVAGSEPDLLHPPKWIISLIEVKEDRKVLKGIIKNKTLTKEQTIDGIIELLKKQKPELVVRVHSL